MSRTSLVAGAPATATSVSTDPEALARGDVVLLPIARLGTRYAALRPGRPRTSAELPAELPVRVAAMEDGRFEVVDGFKRLERWREQGRGLVPAIVECLGSPLELKRLMLAANAPPRTLTALDEAAVVRSLIAEDGLSVRAVAALLGRRPAWVTSRHKLATRLGAYPAQLLARGKLRPTLAGLLTAFAAKDQDALARVIERHGLSGREAAILLHAYRAADEADRRALLREPLARVRPAAGSALTRSPRAEALESRLFEIRRALLDLETFTFPGDLAPAEARRLEALYRSVVQQLGAAAQKLGQSSMSKESIVERAQTEDRCISTDQPAEDADREVPPLSALEEGHAERQDIEPEHPTSAPTQAEESRDQGNGPCRGPRARSILWGEEDRRARGPEPQASHARAPRSGSNDAVLAARPEQAGSVSGTNRRARRQEADGDQNPPRDPGGRLHWPADDPGPACGAPSGRARAQSEEAG
jgi:hypothetical protein